MLTTLKTVRRDWPHLHWWRAIADDGIFEAESEQLAFLREAGFEFDNVKDDGKQFILNRNQTVENRMQDLRRGSVRIHLVNDRGIILRQDRSRDFPINIKPTATTGAMVRWHRITIN